MFRHSRYEDDDYRGGRGGDHGGSGRDRADNDNLRGPPRAPVNDFGNRPPPSQNQNQNRSQTHSQNQNAGSVDRDYRPSLDGSAASHNHDQHFNYPHSHNNQNLHDLKQEQSVNRNSNKHPDYSQSLQQSSNEQRATLPLPMVGRREADAELLAQQDFDAFVRQPVRRAAGFSYQEASRGGVPLRGGHDGDPDVDGMDGVFGDRRYEYSGDSPPALPFVSGSSSGEGVSYGTDRESEQFLRAGTERRNLPPLVVKPEELERHLEYRRRSVEKERRKSSSSISGGVSGGGARGNNNTRPQVSPTMITSIDTDDSLPPLPRDRFAPPGDRQSMEDTSAGSYDARSVGDIPPTQRGNGGHGNSAAYPQQAPDRDVASQSGLQGMYRQTNTNNSFSVSRSQQPYPGGKYDENKNSNYGSPKLKSNGYPNSHSEYQNPDRNRPYQEPNNRDQPQPSYHQGNHLQNGTTQRAGDNDSTGTVTGTALPTNGSKNERVICRALIEEVRKRREHDRKIAELDKTMAEWGDNINKVAALVEHFRLRFRQLENTMSKAIDTLREKLESRIREQHNETRWYFARAKVSGVELYSVHPNDTTSPLNTLLVPSGTWLRLCMPTFKATDVDSLEAFEWARCDFIDPNFGEITQFWAKIGLADHSKTFIEAITFFPHVEERALLPTTLSDPLPLGDQQAPKPPPARIVVSGNTSRGDSGSRGHSSENKSHSNHRAPPPPEPTSARHNAQNTKQHKQQPKNRPPLAEKIVSTTLAAPTMTHYSAGASRSEANLLHPQSQKQKEQQNLQNQQQNAMQAQQSRRQQQHTGEAPQRRQAVRWAAQLENVSLVSPRDQRQQVFDDDNESSDSDHNNRETNNDKPYPADNGADEQEVFYYTTSDDEDDDQDNVVQNTRPAFVHLETQKERNDKKSKKEQRHRTKNKHNSKSNNNNKNTSNSDNGNEQDAIMKKENLRALNTKKQSTSTINMEQDGVHTWPAFSLPSPASSPSPLPSPSSSPATDESPTPQADHADNLQSLATDARSSGTIPDVQSV